MQLSYKRKLSEELARQRKNVCSSELSDNSGAETIWKNWKILPAPARVHFSQLKWVPVHYTFILYCSKVRVPGRLHFHTLLD